MSKLLAQNKKARYDYFIEDKYEAGISLTGAEVKSIKAGKVSVKEAYAEVKNGEVYVQSMHVASYEQASIYNVENLRRRKLLLHKSEIKKISKKLNLPGYTLMPLSVYINDRGLIKLSIGVCKGKKMYDKRAVISKAESDRHIQREMKNRGRY